MSSPMHEKLWEHPNPQTTKTHEFKTSIEQKYGIELKDYESLRHWSIDHLAKFWEEVWHFTGIRASAPFTKVVDEKAPMFPRPAFFEGAKLNFAENLLYPACNPPEDSLAVIAATEESREHITWKELREKVRKCTAAMSSLGVKEGDRVAGYVANHTNALVAMLSATSIGALWTAISPDTGVHAVLDRMQQIEPVLLFADNGVMYNGKVHDVHDKLKDTTSELPTLHAVVIFETIKDHAFDLTDIPVQRGKPTTYSVFISSVDVDTPLDFAQLPADHPVYILYSSGTTGKPKCIVHGAIGTLIQHKKEHSIQCSILPGDRLFYFTTCTWMMWHWLVSGLASGATIILYDGSPFRPLDSSGNGELAMPRLIDELGITHFGTSAKYLSVLEQKSIYPKTPENGLSLKTLKAIYSTGSPLPPSTFHYIYRAFGNINLGSITGGTDILSLFGAPSQISPVHAGEVQVRGLGMAIEIFLPNPPSPFPQVVTLSNTPGDLVCVKPFPCQPLTFWGSDGEEKYRGSYFERFFVEGDSREGEMGDGNGDGGGKGKMAVWHHGDFVHLNPSTGGMIMLGRSDGVLKPAGVRFGSSEIYNLLQKYFPEEIEDALCISRRRKDDTDETVILFLKTAPGKGGDDKGELVTRVKETIRRELSARHVPAIVDECPEIPVTTNGKKVEVVVKGIVSGVDVSTGASVANGACLEWFRGWVGRNP